MTQQLTVKTFRAMNQEEHDRINQFLKPYKLTLEGGSHITYSDGSEEVWIGFYEKMRTFSRKVMAEAIQKEFGWKKVIVEGREI